MKNAKLPVPHRQATGTVPEQLQAGHAQQLRPRSEKQAEEGHVSGGG